MYRNAKCSIEWIPAIIVVGIKYFIIGGEKQFERKIVNVIFLLVSLHMSFGCAKESFDLEDYFEYTIYFGSGIRKLNCNYAFLYYIGT